MSHTCPYCKELVERHWFYCHKCGKPLITNLDNFLKDDSSSSYKESSSFYSNFEEEELDPSLIKNEELEYQLMDIDNELRQKEIQGELMGNLLLKKASIYYKARDFSNAISNLELALKNFLEGKDLLQVAICHNEIGLIHEEGGYFDQAIYHFDEALNTLRQLEDHIKIIQVLNNLGNVYYIIKDLEKSYEYYQQALTLAEEHHFELEAVKSASNLVEILFNFKDYDRISKILKRNLEFFERDQDLYGVIQTLVKYGKLNYFLGEINYEESYQYFNNALNLIDKIQDRISIYLKAKLEWECYFYRGKLNLLWDNEVLAEDNLVKALEAIRKFEIEDHINEGIVLEDLADLYLLKGQYKKSIEYLNFTAEIFKKYGDKAKIAEIKRNIAKIYSFNLQNAMKARVIYEQALEIFENLDYIKQAAEILNSLGDLCINENNFQDALNFFKRSKLYYQDLQDQYNIDLLTEKINSLKEY
ncbi:MAG: tetratricopeptide repeat protein [Candidatus Hodarchaeota archaeon]